MTVTQPNLVADLAQAFLDAAVDVIPNPPERRYISHNEPAWDCEQLTVHLARMRPKPTDSGGDRCAVVLQATFAITIVRCYPPLTDKGFPSADKMNTASTGLLVDAWALFKGLTRKWSTESTPFGLPCKQTTWNGLDPRGPTDLAGWRLEVQVDLLPVPTA
jgi:hypothetical protein